MKFTVVFESHESHDKSYGLVFIPCPVWVRGKEEIVNLHPSSPNYTEGDLQPLLAREFENVYIEQENKTAVVVVHPTGNGNEDHLNILLDDLGKAGFKTHVIRMG